MRFKQNIYFIKIIIIFVSVLFGYPMFLAINTETLNIFTTGFLKYLMPIFETVLVDILLILVFYLFSSTYVYVYDDKIIIKKKKRIVKEYQYNEISIMRYGSIFKVILMKDDVWGLKIESYKGDIDIIISKKHANVIINQFYKFKKKS